MAMPARVAFSSELVTTPKTPETEREPPTARGRGGALAACELAGGVGVALACGTGTTLAAIGGGGAAGDGGALGGEGAFAHELTASTAPMKERRITGR
jgi:hypothetical protein